MYVKSCVGTAPNCGVSKYILYIRAVVHLHACRHIRACRHMLLILILSSMHFGTYFYLHEYIHDWLISCTESYD